VGELKKFAVRDMLKKVSHHECLVANWKAWPLGPSARWKYSRLCNAFSPFINVLHVSKGFQITLQRIQQHLHGLYRHFTEVFCYLHLLKYLLAFTSQLLA
jgi:hypothetical protein